jgi:TDG/mug DNA glycosylase family protein
VSGSEDPHRRTLEVYERRARDWERVRSPGLGPARELTELLAGDPTDHQPVVVDLGCGPGWHLPVLPTGAIALDGAAAMLDLVPHHAPDAPRVRADLRALPFARGSVDAVWADRSLVHVHRSLVPSVLWDVHRSMRVGGRLCMSLFEDDREHAPIDGDDFPGRSFSGWDESLLRVVVEGAGFELELLERVARGEAVELLRVWARRARTLADTVGPGMRLLLVGLNPSLVAADAGVGFHRSGNRAWPALAAAGLATVDRDPWHLLVHHRIGMSDLVKTASPRASSLTAAQYVHGIERLDALCTWLQPAAVCIVGLSGWRAAVDRRAVVGVQPSTLGGRPVYVMPNTSGVNTHVSLQDLTEHLAAAARLADHAAARLADDTAARLADDAGDRRDSGRAPA